MESGNYLNFNTYTDNQTALCQKVEMGVLKDEYGAFGNLVARYYIETPVFEKVYCDVMDDGGE